MAAHPHAIRIAPLAESPARWELYDDNFPESSLHRDNVDRLRDVLRAWAKRTGEHRVVCNLALRRDRSNPKVAVDPEVCLLSATTVGSLADLRTWMPGHATPPLAIEIFNSENDLKDYTLLPEKYAASGIRELVFFDAGLGAPAVHGGRYRLQLWERAPDGAFVRTYAGEGPARSTVLDAWFVVVDKTKAMKMLEIAADEGGRALWRTEVEIVHARIEALRAETEALRAETEALRAETEALRAETEALRAETEALRAETKRS